MSQGNPTPGSIVWHDLTVADAPGVRDFYKAVVGWSSADVDMGGYSDYAMIDEHQGAVAGVCHSRGINASVPSQWLVYICVASVTQAAARATGLGGTIVDGPRRMDGRDFCIVRDPAGACFALISP